MEINGSDGHNGQPPGPAINMTLRDYFAGQAASVIIMKWSPTWDMEKFLRDSFIPSNVAVAAYDVADAMIAERDRVKES